MPETLQIRGDLTVTVRDSKSGQVVSEQTVRNRIVNTGLLALLRLLAQEDGDPPANLKLLRLEVGQGSNPAAAGDVVLQTPFNPHKYISLGDVEKTITEDLKLVIIGAIQDTDEEIDGESVSEAALWLGPEGSSAVLFARQAHYPVTKQAGLLLEYRWVIQISVGA